LFCGALRGLSEGQRALPFGNLLKGFALKNPAFEIEGIAMIDTDVKTERGAG